jgi:hypothetical protein
MSMSSAKQSLAERFMALPTAPTGLFCTAASAVTKETGSRCSARSGTKPPTTVLAGGHGLNSECMSGRETDNQPDYLECVTDDGRREGPSAAWGVLAVVCLAGVTAIPAWIQVISAHAASALWVAIASALTLIAAVGLVMCFAAVGFRWRIPLPRRRHPPTPVRVLSPGLGAMVDKFPESIPPLSMSLQAEEWELWRDWIWIGSLKIRITNNADRVIRLRHFSLNPDLGSHTPPRQSQEKIDTVLHETIRRGDSYTAHIRRMDLESGDSVSGWYVHWVSVSADGGRPPCTFVATDAAGDTYELPIPARERRSHRMPGGGLEPLPGPPQKR